MHPTRLLLREAYHRTPLIKFLGKRTPPKNISPSAAPAEPHVHPASPTDSLPDSFMSYRSKAQQHGPLAGHRKSSSQSPSPSAASSHAYGSIGGHSGHELGGVEPAQGLVWDRSELPKRFWRLAWTEEEMEAIEMGGAGVRVGWGAS